MITRPKRSDLPSRSEDLGSSGYTLRMFLGPPPRSLLSAAILAAVVAWVVITIFLLGAAPGPGSAAAPPSPEATRTPDREIEASSEGTADPRPAARSEFVRVFAIARSLNANLVSYEVRVGRDGFSSSRPVRARWEMLASGGHTEPLNRLEQGVYGVNVEMASRDEVRFSIAALPSRKFVVRLTDDGPRALSEVDGTLCVVESIYISSSGGLIPSVRYAELRGRSLADGSERRERIKP